MKKNKKENLNRTKISQHKQEGKKLIPPFLQIPITPSSWIDDRLPEMLWAVLIIGNCDREEALKFYRHVGKFVEGKEVYFDVTISGIGKLGADERKEFIKHLILYSDDVNKILQLLVVFNDLPAVSDWKEILGIPANIDWQKIYNGVIKTFWHQSQEATDCRWAKVLCMIVSGKMKLMDEESLKEILYYPDYGDMRKVRPTIRASEIAPAMQDRSNGWAKNFWKQCFNETECLPEETYNKKIKKRQVKLIDEIEQIRPFYFEEVRKVRNKLIDHLLPIPKSSEIDSRYDGAFGLAIYGMSIFVEIIYYRNPLSITGRLALRSLVETYITFAYLLKKEVEEPKIWDDYRGYGSGQLKLVHSKMSEMDFTAGSINLNEIDEVANEDRSVEFIPINLGHWDSVDLRKMSIEVGLKDLYDKFYGYTSGFMHANWGAVRESIYQKCVNPLHRFHRLPVYEMPLMPSVTEDCREIVNSILECLDKAYPKFDLRISEYKQEGKDIKEASE